MGEQRGQRLLGPRLLDHPERRVEHHDDEDRPGVDDLAQAFVDIGTELRSQYSLAYTPSTHSADGKFHPIHIEILHRHGLKVRARQGYYAPLPESSRR